MPNIAGIVCDTLHVNGCLSGAPPLKLSEIYLPRLPERSVCRLARLLWEGAYVSERFLPARARKNYVAHTTDRIEKRA